MSEHVQPFNTVQSITVGYRYPVRMTHDVFSLQNDDLGTLLGSKSLGSKALHDAASGVEIPRIAAVFDQGLVQHHPDLPERWMRYAEKHGLPIVGEPLQVPGGEACKNCLSVVQSVVMLLERHRLCRHSVLLAVGGGAMLDAVGFAASLVHRGVRLVRMPSTSLSQGDSGVGVKNGINFGNQKNYLGCFAPPYAVVADLLWLRSLPLPLLLDGIAEAVKVAVIKDAPFFELLETASQVIADIQAGQTPDWSLLEQVIMQSARIHLEHIAGSGDPFEQGTARPLDFGHWAGHRLESMSDYDVRHGQGVAIGIAVDSCYAMLAGQLAESDCHRILDLLDRWQLPLWHPLLDQNGQSGSRDILQGLTDFREHLGGHLAITLPTGIGQAIEVDQMDESLILQAIDLVRERSQS